MKYKIKLLDDTSPSVRAEFQLNDANETPEMEIGRLRMVESYLRQRLFRIEVSEIRDEEDLAKEVREQEKTKLQHKAEAWFSHLTSEEQSFVEILSSKYRVNPSSGKAPHL